MDKRQKRTIAKFARALAFEKAQLKSGRLDAEGIKEAKEEIKWLEKVIEESKGQDWTEQERAQKKRRAIELRKSQAEMEEQTRRYEAEAEAKVIAKAKATRQAVRGGVGALKFLANNFTERDDADIEDNGGEDR